MNNKHLTETRFSNLELSDSILQGLTQAGFKQCTPIQDKALPLLLRGKDIAGQAQTGTGKTATFLLATFQRLINDEVVEEDEGMPEWLEDLEPEREILPEAAREKAAEKTGEGRAKRPDRPRKPRS